MNTPDSYNSLDLGTSLGKASLLWHLELLVPMDLAAELMAQGYIVPVLDPEWDDLEWEDYESSGAPIDNFFTEH